MDWQFLSLIPNWLVALLTVLVPMVAADIDDLFRELKDSVVTETWTRGHNLVNRLMSGAETKQVNTRAYIFTRQNSMGGDARSHTFDAASFAAGTNPFTDQLSLSAIGAAVSYSATSLMQYAAANTKVAVRPFMARYIASMMDGFKEHFECWLNAPSNDGVMAILSGVQNTTEYILNSVDDLSGGYLLLDGSTYQIIAAAAFPATIRATGPYRVLPDGTGLDKRANPAIVQFAQSNGSAAAAIAGFTAEDRVVAFGGGNAWFNSIPYHVSSLATGTWQGANRSAPINRCTRVNGGQSQLTAAMVRRLLAAIAKYKGTAGATDGLIPYCSQDQIVQWLNSAQAMTAIRLTDAAGDGIGEIYDRMLGDVKVNKKAPLVSNRCNPTQFRFIRLSDYVWISMQEPEFRPNVAGGKLHEQHDGDGLLVSGHTAIIQYLGNLGCRDVTSQGVAYDLTKPTLED